MKGYSASAIFSGAIFASILGETSPKMSTATVMTAVETTTEVSPFAISFPKNTPAIEVAEMLTRLFPTKTVEMNLS